MVLEGINRSCHPDNRGVRFDICHFQRQRETRFSFEDLSTYSLELNRGEVTRLTERGTYKAVDDGIVRAN